jgi:acetoin utilization deacetylase AcuC-like enzyme
MAIACSVVASMEHDDPMHPENNRRVPAIVAGLRATGLLDEMLDVAPVPATREQVARNHDPRLIESLEQRVAMGPAVIDPAPTYVTAQSFDAALLSAGGALTALSALLDGRATEALAVIRPPGHHAEPERVMGFCLFNNIAIAAREARARGVERIMIFDFDVHHGNGTQRAFYLDPSVLFVSTHQWGIYPGTGAESETGAEAGRGFTVNVPFPSGAGDEAMARAVDEIATPLAHRFRPQLVLVSAGFDAHFRDPLASMQVSGHGYHYASSALAGIARRWADGRILFVLEGGYDLPALANGMVNVARALRGEEPDDSLGRAPYPEPDVGALIDRLRSRHDLG